jgi:hypothetical protein
MLRIVTQEGKELMTITDDGKDIVTDPVLKEQIEKAKQAEEEK